AEVAPPPNDGYITRDQEKSWFKRIMLLSWTELKRYRKNVIMSITIHSLPILAVLCVWGVVHFLNLNNPNVLEHKAQHIAAFEEFPLN
ncbi:hypothetical protein PFISCL1PPCAC_18014, partial [Pristionchus fissidentatus]